MKNLAICIPTYRRPERQITLNNLPESLHKFVWLVVRPEEEEEHSFWPRVLVLSKKIKNISETRQWILDNSKVKKIIMFDDDLSFFKRISKEDIRLRRAKPKQIIKMVKLTYNLLDDFVHCGISNRDGNNRIIEPYKDVAFMDRALAYRADKLTNLNIRYDRMATFAGMDVLLQLFRKGLPNRVLYKYAQAQSGINSPGGCSTYRTINTINKCSHLLKKYHPEFVKVEKRKIPQSHQDYGGKTAYKTRIGWKKAYESYFRK